MSPDPLTLQNLFVGMVPGPRVQAALQRHRAEWCWTGGEELPDPRLLHMKLFALPGLPATTVPALRKGLGKVCLQPLELVLRKTAILPVGGTDAAVIALDRNQALEALRHDVAAVLEAIGYQPPPMPALHVALALNAASARPPPVSRPIRWRAEEFALVWSRAAGDSPWAWYDVLASWGPTPVDVPAAPVQTTLFG